MLTKDMVWFQAYLANINNGVTHIDALKNAMEVAEAWQKQQNDD